MIDPTLNIQGASYQLISTASGLTIPGADIKLKSQDGQWTLTAPGKAFAFISPGDTIVLNVAVVKAVIVEAEDTPKLILPGLQ